MCKRQHTHKSVVKSNTVGMVLTYDLAFFSLGERYCKNARLKNNFFGAKMYAEGGGEGHVRMGCGERFCFRRLQVLTALDLSKELI